MILGIFHKGSGLGNQLFRYVATRVLALDEGYDFSMINPEGFKGASFMKLDMGKLNDIDFHIEEPAGKVIPHTDLPLWEEKKVTLNGIDIRGYDPKFNLVKDNTIIDGEFQGEKYFIHRKNEIREWLRVGNLDLPDDLCIINFRGGEYVRAKDLFLPKNYWQNAISNMRKINPNMRFSVATDDIKSAKKKFSDFEITHELKDDYTKIQNAHYLILSNASFALFPAWLNEKVKLVIAPKYWARHNVSNGYWSCEYNIVNGWMYQNRNGRLQTYEECKKDLENYKAQNKLDQSPITVETRTLKERIEKILPKGLKSIIKKVFRL
ncbi:MAG: glycosyl transferase [bacterium]|nr:glycosyl transferase [bacterium]